MTPSPRSAAVRVTTFRGEPAALLVAGDYRAVFLPHLGMLGASLRWRGGEHLSLHGGLGAFRGGHTTGLPLLAPWANRLGSDRFRLGSTTVDLAGNPAVHRDGNGLPMHGTLVGAVPWELARLDADDERAECEAVLDYGTSLGAPYRAFPAPHRLEVRATLDAEGLEVRTTLRATGRRAVPVAFGWHPYFRLPGVRRGELAVDLPARRELHLDDRQLPTGAERRRPAETVALGGTALDPGYRLGRDRTFRLHGGGTVLTTTFDAGYPYAQVYAPRGRAFAAIEPMTAVTDGLRTGACRTVPPGGSTSATFRVRVD